MKYNKHQVNPLPHFYMERIEIYTSRKKSMLVLICSIVFVLLGIWMVFSTEEVVTVRYRSPIFIRSIGIIAVVFFGYGCFVAVKRLVKTEIAVILNHKGMNLNPKKSLIIEWKNIIGIHETSIRNQRILIIVVNNPEYWIDLETNIIRKNLMRFNFKNFKSPFNLSSAGLEISHNELLETLNIYFKKYKNEALCVSLKSNSTN